MTNLQNARRYEDLLGDGVEPSPYEFALLFKTDGWLSRRRAKNRFKMLRAIDPKLRRMLRDGERVFFVTSGTTSNAAEQFFAGTWVAQALNRRALVFTTDRVLLQQIDSRQRPGDLVSQIAYTSIAEVKATWTGYCQLKLRNNSKLNFMGVPKADRKELATFLTDVVKPGADSSFDRNGPAIEHLCPRCFAPVSGHPETCPHCQSRFKLARTATLRSLIFPGLGDLYLGHRTIAVFEMLGGALAWFSLVVAPLAGVPDENGRVIGTTPGYWGVTFVMLAVIHGIDAAMARQFALKGHHPA